MTIRLHVSGRGTVSNTDTPTVRKAKDVARMSGWLTDPAVKSFEVFVQVEDYTNRIIHEWDAEALRWYEVEMWDGAQPT